MKIVFLTHAEQMLRCTTNKQRLAFGLLIVALHAPVHAQIKIGTSPSSIVSDANLQVQADSGIQLVVTRSKGSVGIGTSSPANQLEVVSDSAGTSGVRLTNLTNATVLATDANGYIVAGTVVTPGANLAPCTCGDVKMNAVSSASTLPAANGVWKLMNGAVTGSSSCPVSASNATGQFLIMDGNMVGLANQATPIAQAQLPNVTLTFGPFWNNVGYASSQSSWPPAIVLGQAQDAILSKYTSSLNGGVVQQPLTALNLPRMSVNYYVCITN